ncbi:MAG: hypothetical protein Q8P56_01515 [Candidatus Uhrbacteria bacterium]|nr:hypothetical protein [Candidatus Uhrbacteria bacterium]
MSEEKAIYDLTVRKPMEVINFEEYAMTSQGVLNQVRIVHEVLEGVMKVDEHYGTIPGTKKPSLYKAGAEKLSLTFRLRPEYKISKTEFPNGHREYEIICTLYHIPTGQSVGQGVGSATTMEGKYRYRGGEKEGTGHPIPKEYWNLKKSDPTKAQELIGGSGFSAGKIDGKWEICSTGEKQEHDNPADYWNTVLKMSKKRAHVDAILTATAASDIFTQDVEDMPEVIPQKQEAKKETLPDPEKAKEEVPSGEPTKDPPPSTQKPIMPITDEQRANIRVLMNDKGMTSEEDQKKFWKYVIGKKNDTALAEKFILHFDEYYEAYSRTVDAQSEESKLR